MAIEKVEGDFGIFPGCKLQNCLFLTPKIYSIMILCRMLRKLREQIHDIC